MNCKRRMIAWMLSIAMLLGPFGAQAEELSARVATNGEAEPSPTPTSELTSPTGNPEGTPTQSPKETPSQSPEETPSQSPEGTPTQSPEGTPTGSPEETPSQSLEGTPSQSPEETPALTGTPVPAGTPKPETTPFPEEFAPQGEVWIELEDGTRLDGSMQKILDDLQENGAKATVYLRTKEAIRVKGIDVGLFDEQVTLALSEEAFGEAISLYEIEITVVESEQRQVPDLIIQAVRKDAKPTDESTQEPTQEPTDEPTQEPTDEPTQEPTDETTQEPTDEPTDEPEATPTLTPEPTPTATPEPTPTPTPAVTLTVAAQGYREDGWSTEIPVFTLSGIEKGSKDYVYGVFYCNEQLILLDQDADTYVLQEQGEISLRFAILDMMGDIVSLSQQYDVRVDAYPPSGPYIEQDFESDTVAWLNISDGESGIEAISYDFGQTWEAYNPDFEPYSIMGEKGEIIEAGKIVVRDRVGHTSRNEEEFTFGRKANGLLPAGGGSGGGGKPAIKHVKETMDYSLANYNALELKFPRTPVSELVAGDTALSLALTQEEAQDGEAGLFTAALDTWRPDEQTTPEKPNALVLSAESSEGMNTWSFTGDVYKLLYNSGIDYLVMTSGDYMTAIPTAGFTGGTQYAKLKASGVSTRKFAYTLCQDEALRETTMSVTVEGETYMLGEERDQPMYRYDVLVGTKDMMRRPYESYKPQNQTAESQEALAGGADKAKADEP